MRAKTWKRRGSLPACWLTQAKRSGGTAMCTAAQTSAKEIDRELKNAQIVMVLWSPASIASAWVQDEAAEGRDSGRLVPATLDSVKPPLGFRQLQCIDLSPWDKQGGAEPIDDLLEAISKMAGDRPWRRHGESHRRPRAHLDMRPAIREPK